MDEKGLGAFVDSIKTYFAQFSDKEPEIGVPFVQSEKILRDYTGCVSITGKCHGSVYVSLSQGMLEDISKALLEENTVNREDMVDVAGEIANTLAGDACAHLTDEFSLSVPVVVVGKSHDLSLPRLKSPVYVVPFAWRDYKSYVFVGIDRE